MRCGAVRCTITCSAVRLCHFADGFGVVFVVCAVHAIWWTPLATTVHGHFLINTAREVVVLYLMQRGWLLCPSFFILLVFRAQSIFPFEWFSSIPFIPLVLVTLRSGLCPRNPHQMSYPNLSSSHGISVLHHFMDFNSSKITLATCLTTLDFCPPIVSKKKKKYIYIYIYNFKT